MNEITCDVVIAGAGPAGTTTAYHLAKLGFKVVVVEARPPHDVWGKPCGDAIALHHFERAKLPTPPTGTIKNRVRGVKVYSPSKETVYFVGGEGLIIDRKAYGSYILNLVEEMGSQVLLRSAVVDVVMREGRLTGIKVVTPKGALMVRANIVVEATGTARCILRKVPREWDVAEDLSDEDVNIAYRKIVLLEEDLDEPDVLRIFLDQKTAPGGYWWFFPEGRRAANIGLGVQGVYYPHVDPSRRVEELLSSLSKKYVVVKQGGAPVPTRRPLPSLVAPGLLVVGDAGYAVNPLHGGGMGYAFETGYLAALAAAEALEKGDANVRNLWSLNVAYMRGTGAKQAALDLFRMFLQKLTNYDIDYGMKNRLIPEADVYTVSSKGDLSPSVVEKALIVLRGLRRPSLLMKLKLVADYMKKISELYRRYPERPEELKAWRTSVERLIMEFKERMTS